MLHERKLKNILKNPRFQLKMAFSITFFCLLLTFLNFYIFYYYIEENYSLIIDMVGLSKEAKTLLYTELDQIMNLFFSFSAIYIFTIFIISLLFSHRIAGPLYKLKNTFIEVQKGDLNKRISPRKKDEFKDVTNAFNNMMDELSKNKK